MDLTSNLFVLCTNMKVYLFNYSQWVELSMNIHEEKGKMGILANSENTFERSQNAAFVRVNTAC